VWTSCRCLALPTVRIHCPATQLLTHDRQVIEGGKTENLSAKDLAELGFCAVAYPWTLVAAKIKGAPPQILSYSEVCKGVGFNKYWDEEERYKFNEAGLINGQHVTEAKTNGTR
jgi:hypothetical protein